MFLIVDAATGLAPVTGYLRIERVEGDPDDSWTLTTTSTGPEAGEEASPIGSLFARPGERRLFRVHARVYESSDIVDAVVPATGGLVTVCVELRPDPEAVAWLRIRLVIAGAVGPDRLQVNRHDSGGSSGHVYDVEDRTVSLDLEPGAHYLSVEDLLPPRDRGPYWLPAELRFELLPREEKELDVPLRQGGWVFVPGSIEPSPSVVRWLCGDDTRETGIVFHVHRGRTGVFLGLLPPGRWTLWFGEGRHARTGEVEVRAGEVVILEPERIRRVGAASGDR